MLFRSFYRDLAAGGKSASLEAQTELMMMSHMPIMLKDFRLVIGPMIAAISSSTGMAVVRSAGFSAEGKAALAEMRGAATAAAGERVGLVELSGGVF